MTKKKKPTFINRIVRHIRVRAGDLIPHELNPRIHNKSQRDTLLASLKQFGFCRSLVVYEVEPDTYKIIDGHLRADIDLDALVDCDVLDVSEAEAQALLLTLDPLSGLGDLDNDKLAALRAKAHSSDDHLLNLWESLAANPLPPASSGEPRLPVPCKEQYFVLVECDSELAQVDALTELTELGYNCRALLS